MKKISYLAAAALLLPAAVLFTANPANAQRKNTTSHDVKVVDLSSETYKAEQQPNYKNAKHKMKNHEAEMDKCGCKGDKKCKKKCHKKYMDGQVAEYQEEYQEALNKISRSSFSDKQKDILVKQATENRDLAIKQFNERMELRKQQMQERMEYDMAPMMKDKINRKAVKKVNKIG